MEYFLTRTNRKTAAIYVRDGRVEVRAPLRLSRREIDSLVLSKEKWINQRLEKSIEQAKQREEFKLDYGSFATLRGDAYPLTERAGTHAGFDGKVFYLPSALDPVQIKSVIVQVYRRFAKAYLTERVLYYSNIMGAAPAVIRINGAKTRWGSCSAKRSVNFSWRLIMADGDVIDYVIVHEAAHLFEMNHSARFWAIVGRVLPDTRSGRHGFGSYRNGSLVRAGNDCRQLGWKHMNPSRLRSP